MSLNSRIAIRDTYEARAVVIDYHVETRLRFTARPESTRNTIILEPEMPRKDLMKQLPSLPEAEEEEVVNCKSCGPHYGSSFLCLEQLPRLRTSCDVDLTNWRRFLCFEDKQTLRNGSQLHTYQ